ncbi:hypothetical protein HGRIS_004592 [Hohenbuehelia grisea]|uniref:WD40 repeat-like protein n=1 Tax=Hohenbuehelia grisea TaxID=104357 RepID=A0ABR3JCL3_9AGAR
MISMTFSRDGALLVCGSNVGTVDIWDALSGCRRTSASIHPPISFVTALDISLDHEIVAFGHCLSLFGGACSVALWHTTTGHIRELGTHRAAMKSIQFDGIGATLAALEADGTLTHYEVKKRRLQATRSNATSYFFTRQHALLYVKQECDEFLLVDHSSGAILFRFSGTPQNIFIVPSHQSPCVCILARSASSSTVSISLLTEDGTTEQSDLAGSENLPWPPNLVLTPDASVIGSFVGGGFLSWEASSGRRLPAFIDAGSPAPGAFRFSPYASQMAYFHQADRTIRICDMPWTTDIASSNMAHSVDEVKNMTFRADGILHLSGAHVLAYTAHDRSMAIFLLETSAFPNAHLVECNATPSGRAQLLAVSPNGERIAWWDSSEASQSTYIHEISRPHRQITLRHYASMPDAHQQGVFSTNGKYLVRVAPSSSLSLGDYTALEIWEVASGFKVKEWVPLRWCPPHCSCWSIATANTSATIACLNLNLCEGYLMLCKDDHDEPIISSLNEAREHSTDVVTGTFSGNDLLVAFAFPDQITIWDGGDGTRLAPITTTNLSRPWVFPWPMPFKFHVTAGGQLYVVSPVEITHIPAPFIPTRCKPSPICDNHLYHVHADGWAYDGTTRLCWIPADHRPGVHLGWPKEATRGHELAILTAEKHFMLLDFSKLCRFTI